MTVLREAILADMEKIFRWRNDAGIVALSASRRPVSWADHQSWFPTVLQSERHLLFVVVASTGGEAGTVRFDRDSADGNVAAITVYLVAGFRGRGIGTVAIEQGCERAFRTWPALLRVEATIRPNNDASVRAFRRAGFDIVAAPAQSVRPILALKARPQK